jgi:outer membrane protein assembly factor BamB
VVFVRANDDYVYALNVANGVLIWKYQAGGQVQSSPAIAYGTVYIGSNGDYFTLSAYPMWDIDIESLGLPWVSCSVLAFDEANVCNGDATTATGIPLTAIQNQSTIQPHA